MTGLVFGSGSFWHPGIGLAFGAGSNFAPGTITDLRFDIGRYRLGGGTVPASAIDAYHTRSSARWAERSDAAWQEFATNAAAILPGRGYDSREGYTVLNTSPLNPGSMWSVEGGGTIAPISGAYLGFSDAAVFASAGQMFHRARSVIPNNTIVNGGVYAVRAIYAAGTSPNARVRLRAVSAAQDIQVQGPVGALVAAIQSAGTVSNLENISHGGGVYECRFIATVNVSSNVWSLEVGPHSAVAGETVIIVAAQIVQRGYQMPFGTGTVAADTMVVPAAAAGMAVNPAASGLTMFWRGRDFPYTTANPRMAEVRVDPENRLSFLRNASSSASVTFGSRGSIPASSNTIADAPHGTEMTMLATWRTDGTTWIKIGPNAAQTGTGRTMAVGTLSSIGVGCHGGGANCSNSITRRFGLLPYSLSDADALALFNQINEGL